MRPFKESDTIEVMRRVPIFSALGEAELRELMSACQTRNVHAGAQIFTRDDAADRFYVILGGKVKLYKLSPKGDEQILHLYGPSGTFGEAAMWAGINYPAYAEALTDTTLLVVRSEILKRAIAGRPELAFGMLAGMSLKLREFNQLIEQLSLREVPARLAGILLDLSREAGRTTIRLHQSKRELASQIGTVAETLSRSLKKLKEAGLIEVHGSRITILDPEGLRELMES
jgi:CRP/FNR family transcriptional regulator